jgi:oxygen-dependent protoporphyrinogen oxidase
MTDRRRVAIVGGGIAGLSAAWSLHRAMEEGDLPLECRLFESEAETGGVIRSERRDGFLLDLGPDALFRAKPAAADLAREIGLGDQLINARPQEIAVQIYARGCLHPLPEGLELVAPSRILPLITTGLLSPLGKVRMMFEPFIPARRDGADESIAGFVRRRLGDETARRIAGPLMAGIHAGDPELLSLRSTFPRLADLELKHGSLTLGMRRARAQQAAARTPSSPAGPPFMSFAGGVQSFTDTLASRIRRVEIVTGRRVRKVAPASGRYRLEVDGGEGWQADACVMAVPAGAAAGLLEELDLPLARSLAGIRYVSTAVVFLGYGNGAGVKIPASSGFLIPRQESRTFFGCTFVSNKFEGRAPEGSTLVRAFVGGAGAEEKVELGDDDLVAGVRRDLEELIGLKAEPSMIRIRRWPMANPQYEVGHQQAVEAVDVRLREHPGLFVTGSGLRGVGVPDGVTLGRAAAGKVLQHLEKAGGAAPVP